MPARYDRTDLLTAFVWAYRSADLTQEEIAERLGLTQPTVSRWEREVHAVMLGELAEVAGPKVAAQRRKVKEWLEGEGVPIPLPAEHHDELRLAVLQERSRRGDRRRRGIE